MENKEHLQQARHLPPLEFKIENQVFHTSQQYWTGAELKQKAGIPSETELFLSVRRPFEDELIEDMARVNLARPESEYFYVRKKLHFFINNEPFTWYKQYIKGIQIRELGGISIEDEIFLDIKEGWQDDQILDDEIVDLARPGKEKFISKSKRIEFIIIVNAREKVWNEADISFEQIVVLAFGVYDNNPNRGYTATYSRGWVPKPEGTMVKGSFVRVKNKMIFDVTATDKS